MKRRSRKSMKRATRCLPEYGQDFCRYWIGLDTYTCISRPCSRDRRRTFAAVLDPVDSANYSTYPMERLGFELERR